MDKAMCIKHIMERIGEVETFLKSLEKMLMRSAYKEGYGFYLGTHTNHGEAISIYDLFELEKEKFILVKNEYEKELNELKLKLEVID